MYNRLQPSARFFTFCVTLSSVVTTSLAAVQCDKGCNESVTAIRFRDPTLTKGCRVYDIAQASLLERAVHVDGDATEIIEPQTNVKYWNITPETLCSPECSNEDFNNLRPGNQASYSGPMPPPGAVENNHARRRCVWNS